MLAAASKTCLAQHSQFSLVFESVRNICLSDSCTVMAIWQACDMLAMNNHILELPATIYIRI